MHARQVDEKVGSAIRRILYEERAIVCLHRPMDHRQPQPAPPVPGGEERIEDPSQVIGSNPRPRILDAKAHGAHDAGAAGLARARAILQ